MKPDCATLFPMQQNYAEATEYVTQAQQGDREALKQFYVSFQPAITRLCGRMLERSADVEDAVQTTFAKAFHALPRFRNECSLRTWIYRIACNVCLDMLRDRRKAPHSLPETLTAPDTMLSQTDYLAIHQALQRMAPDQRAILALYYWEDMRCEEIASVLHLSLSAVKMRLFRARNEFRRYYQE